MGLDGSDFTEQKARYTMHNYEFYIFVKVSILAL